MTSSQTHRNRLGLLRSTAIIAASLGAFGGIMGDRIGGLGPSLIWVGMICASVAVLLDLAFRKLLQWNPDLERGLAPATRPMVSSLAIAAQVSILALVTLEVVSRFSHPMPNPAWVRENPLNSLQRPDDTLGWVPAKNYEAVLQLPGKQIEMKTNSRGFRDIEQELDLEKPRVVVIGDSFAVGWGSAFEEGITPRLRGDLPEAQIFNSSWAGWSKDQISLSYGVRAKPLKPDVVLAMFMVEPGVDQSGPLYFGQRKPWFTLKDSRLVLQGMPLTFNVSTDVNRRLYLHWEAEQITGPLVALRFLAIEFPRRHLAMGRRFFPVPDWGAVNHSGLPALSSIESAILADLKKQIEGDGGLLLVALAPRPPVFQNCDDPVGAMRQHLDSYRRIGLNPLDITPFIAEDWERCYNQENHPNGRGLDRMREPLTRKIRQALRSLGRLK